MVELADVTSAIAASGEEQSGLTRERLRMAAVCMVGLALGASILPFCAVGAALGPMMLELGWGADHVSLAYALLMWAGALSIWPVGVLIDRYGARLVVTLGIAAMAGVSLMLPSVGHFWQCCVLVALLGVCGSSGLGYIRIVAGLFGRRRGLFMGLIAAESSILTLVMPIAMNRLVMDNGWRGAFMMIGAALLALAPLIYLGLADGRTRSWSARWSLPGAPPAEGRSTRELVRDRAFWTIVAAGLATTCGLTIFDTAIASRGGDPSIVLHAAPFTAAAFLAGAMPFGLALDRTPWPRQAAVAYLSTAVIYVVWALAAPRFGGEPILIAGLAIRAFAYAAQLTMVYYVFSRYFGLKGFATALGMHAFIQSVFVGLGAPMIARSVSQMGDGKLMFPLGIVALVLAAVLYLLLPAYRYASVGERDGEEVPEVVPHARILPS